MRDITNNSKLYMTAEDAADASHILNQPDNGYCIPGDSVITVNPYWIYAKGFYHSSAFAGGTKPANEAAWPTDEEYFNELAKSLYFSGCWSVNFSLTAVGLTPSKGSGAWDMGTIYINQEHVAQKVYGARNPNYDLTDLDSESYVSGTVGEWPFKLESIRVFGRPDFWEELMGKGKWGMLKP